ncbi:hypothetical protein Vadar_020747 [Vaccinium darrowii]|uniref:Uncharacterized protein n=1 Tax=Vaccinium darrowii TaxID=229202 RepID=A0ACB7Z7R0_9ERIC|nr:hypothetical protein Vadar_020747 [Vaccinium darrowii]
MAAMNSNVLASNYAISGVVSSELMSSSKVSPVASVKFPMIRAQHASFPDSKQANKVTKTSGTDGRRAALFGFAAAGLLAMSSSAANASVFDDYLEKSKANKELNDQKRLATSGANFARAYTVEFGSCKFPQNFTGCQDLAKTKKVKFLSEDIELECKGRDKYKCGSNVFWKW